MSDSENHKGRSGAVRQKALKAVDLANMERHGKREDENGQRRRVREVEPIVVGSLELRDRRDAHMEGIKQSSGAKTAAIHALVQFPTLLIDGNDEKQQRRMVKHACRFMNRFHGGDAVFAARLDRDEHGQHSVDVFLMPRYEFSYADGTKAKKASVSKFTKAAAMARYGRADRRSQGSALQDAWFEYMRDEMGLSVQPPQRKKAAAADRVEPEAYGVQQDRQKLRRDQKAHTEAVSRSLAAHRQSRDRNKAETAKLAAERAAFVEEKKRASIALSAAQKLAENQGRSDRARELAEQRATLHPPRKPPRTRKPDEIGER